MNFFPATLQVMRLVTWAFDEIRNEALEKGYLLTKFGFVFRGREWLRRERGRTLPHGPDHGIS
jgi:hypothetical protein